MPTWIDRTHVHPNFNAFWATTFSMVLVMDLSEIYVTSIITGFVNIVKKIVFLASLSKYKSNLICYAYIVGFN